MIIDWWHWFWTYSFTHRLRRALRKRKRRESLRKPRLAQNELVWYWSSEFNSRLVKWKLSSIFSRVCLESQWTAGRSKAMSVPVNSCFLYRPNENHVAWVYSCVWMEFFFFCYCKYRNCNPVIKWNMTDFLHKKQPLFSFSVHSEAAGTHSFIHRAAGFSFVWLKICFFIYMSEIKNS